VGAEIVEPWRTRYIDNTLKKKEQIMSGIASIIDTKGTREIRPQTLEQMLRTIKHRGLDGEIMRRKAGIAMGVCYACPPASPADEQPFTSRDGQIWAAVDGRIFNRADLLRKIEDQGIHPTGQSDAELVLHMYKLAGQDCLDQLEGEFALVIWDRRQRRLFAARDRLGVRHLFYAVRDGMVYLASEIKAILASGQVERRLDLKALDQVLFMNCPVAPRTMFEGVSALPAGHFLLIQDGHVTQNAYWDLEFAPAEPGLCDEEAYRDQLLPLLREAVRVRMPSDRSLGVYLSGGLDSSTITALMHENGSGDFPAYFSDFALPAYSEREFADLAADAIGVELNTVEMSFERIAANFPHLIWHGEAPLVLAEAASLLTLAKLASQDVNVVLNGEGGDELLAGYVFNDWDRIYRKLQRFPLSLTLPLIRGLLPKLGFPSAFVLSKEEQRPAYEHLGCFPAPLYYNYAVREVTAYYSDDLRTQLRGYCPEADIAQTLNTARMARWDPLSQSLYFSTKVNLPNYLLGPHGDRAAASAGIEAFFPFLDHRLMEFAARLPNDLKVRGRQEKYLLKRALEGILPDEIVHRRKSPMTSPTSPAFLGTDAPDYVQRFLSPQAIEQKGYFDSKKVSQMVERLQNRDLSKDRNNRMDVMLSFPLVGVLSTHILDELFIENLYTNPPEWD
jgi:asparagine synthase (glutamine-hydrolysing)